MLILAQLVTSMNGGYWSWRYQTRDWSTFVYVSIVANTDKMCNILCSHDENCEFFVYWHGHCRLGNFVEKRTKFTHANVKVYFKILSEPEDETALDSYYNRRNGYPDSVENGLIALYYATQMVYTHFTEESDLLSR